MSRELNYSLFEEEKELQPKEALQVPSVPIVSSQIEDRGIMGELVGQIRQLNAAMKSLEMRTSLSENRISSLFSSALSLSERQQKQAQKIEGTLKATVSAVNSRMSQLASRVLHRKAQETQVQEILDRHSQVVQKLEARMEKMQRRITQQEMQLMSYKSVVNELIDRTNR